MNPLAPIINAITCASFHISRDVDIFRECRKDIPGWSQPFHYTFFEAVAGALPLRFRAGVCGVYHGLDLKLFAHAARHHRKEIALAGVDLFSDEPCADWTPEQRARETWEGNGFGQPPDMVAAQRNCPEAILHRSGSVAHLAEHGADYDFIYLDTSHDESTVRAEITALLTARSIAPIKRPLFLAGDDYSEPGAGWGVDRAVTALVPDHFVFFNRIWLTYLPANRFP